MRSGPQQTNACPLCRQKLFAFGEDDDIEDTSPREWIADDELVELSRTLLGPPLLRLIGEIARAATAGL